jgi:hypothetical protein
MEHFSVLCCSVWHLAVLRIEDGDERPSIADFEPGAETWDGVRRSSNRKAIG